MTSRDKPPVPSLVPYPTKEIVMLAGALAVRELGLVDKLKVKEPEENVTEKQTDQSQASLLGWNRGLEQFAGPQDVEVDETEVLGELFNTPDVDEAEEMPEKDVVSIAEFQQSALLLVGLAGLIEKSGSDPKKLKLLEAGQVESQPLFLVLSFFHQWLRAGGLDDVLEPWLGEAVSAVTSMLNLQLQHPYLETCRQLCIEFLEDSLSSLVVLQEEKLQSSLSSFMASLCRSRAIGKHAISCLVVRFSITAQELRQLEEYCCSPTELLREFETLMNLLLELWPKFLSSVLPSRSGGLRKELGYNVADTGEMVPKKSSKKRSSGGGSFQPLLGLRETADLQAEVTTWQTELEKCTAHLSIVQPEFCDAIWSVVAFCKGLLDNLIC